MAPTSLLSRGGYPCREVIESASFTKSCVSLIFKKPAGHIIDAHFPIVVSHIIVVGLVYSAGSECRFVFCVDCLKLPLSQGGAPLASLLWPLQQPCKMNTEAILVLNRTCTCSSLCCFVLGALLVLRTWCITSAGVLLVKKQLVARCTILSIDLG